MIEFLRKLQRLRSWGPAHIKKDQDYKKLLDYFKQLKGIEDPNKKTKIFSEILIRCVWTIRFLTENFIEKTGGSLMNKHKSKKTEMLIYQSKTGKIEFRGDFKNGHSVG